MTNEELMQLFLKQQAEELAEIRQIQKIAEGVLDEYHITIPIKDIGSVVATLGGKIEEAKDAFDHGVIKTGDHSFILSLWQYKVPTDEPVAYYNYAATKLLGLLFIGMGFQTDEDLWQRQPLGQIIHFHDLGPGSDPECRVQAFARAFMMPRKQFLDLRRSPKIRKSTGLTVCSRLIAVANIFMYRRFALSNDTVLTGLQNQNKDRQNNHA